MSSHSGLLLLITLWASLHHGLALPLTEQTDVEAGDAVVPPQGASDAVVPPHRVRTKRCACSNQLDTECHYFCHLDIIWVNTPSKTTVYGLGSALSRRRRSTGRCVCANSADHSCASFCHNSPDMPSPKNAANMPQTNVLSILRSVASMSARLRDAGLLSRRRRQASKQQNER